MVYKIGLSKKVSQYEKMAPPTYSRPEIKEFVEYRESGLTSMWGPPWVKWFPWSR
jgi:hypothetical protein